jgi:ligand-binding SRPBCC domain-containing protein
MKIYKIDKSIELDLTMEEAWSFFSVPSNLNKLTPDSMNFDITSELPEKMYPGMIITYKISPFAGIKMNWVTEITHVNEPYYFVDEQRFGPYKFWHHQHIFSQAPNGKILARDIVHYAIPFGAIGRTFGAVFIQNQLKKIFAYREEVLRKMFIEKH